MKIKAEYKDLDLLQIDLGSGPMTVLKVAEIKEEKKEEGEAATIPDEEKMERLILYLSDEEHDKLYFSFVEWFPKNQDLGEYSEPIPLNYLATRLVYIQPKKDEAIVTMSELWTIKITNLLDLVQQYKPYSGKYPGFKYNESLISHERMN